jgi:hypothetical protein
MTLRPALLGAATLALLGSAAFAGPINLIANGGFETLGATAPSGVNAGRSFEIGNRHIYGQAVTGWTVTDSASARPPAGFGAFNLLMQGTSGRDATNDALTRYTASEQQRLHANYTDAGRVNGGNFIAIDADTQANGPLFQTISGLTAGRSYQLTFEWAVGQFNNRTVFPAPNNWIEAGIDVSFGPSGFTGYGAPFGGGSAAASGQFCETPTLRQFGINPILGSASFSGWASFTCNFTAAAATQVLSFLAVGAPNGLPPVALLDGVSLVEVPAPAALGVFGLALAGLLVARRRRA